MSQLTVAVTGAQGYVGSQIVRAVEARGHSVVELVRRRAPGWPRPQLTFELEGGIDPEALRAHRVNALIHVAWDFRPRRVGEVRYVNRDGSIRLFDAFKAGGGGTGVFISTIASFDGCSSVYGAIKREVEREAIARGFWVVRPGLIQGGGREPGGVVGTMLKLVRKLPVVPILGYGRRVLNPVEADVLATWVARLAERPPADAAEALVVAARPERLSLDDVVRGLIAEYRIGPRLLVPVPWRPAWLALRAAERFGLPIALRSDSVISLMNQDPAPPFSEPPAPEAPVVPSNAR